MTFVVSVEEVVRGNSKGLLSKHSSWERVQLGEIANILNGFPFSSDNFSRDSGTPLIRIRDILKGETQTYYRGEYDETFLVQVGELVVGMDGDFNAARWRGRPSLLNQRVCKLTTNQAFYDGAFLGYVLAGYLSAINAATPSLTVKHLSSRTIAEIPLPLPPLDEQKRLAKKIDELFSDLDAGVAALERARANLKRYRAAVLKAAVEGKLTEQWRKAHPLPTPGRARQVGDVEPASKLLERILAERRRKWEAAQLAKYAAVGKASPKGWKDKYSEPTKPDVSDLSELPDGWCWATVDQICEVGTGTTPSRSNSRYWTNGTVPWVASSAVNQPFVSAVHEPVTELALEETTLKIYPKHTLILALYGEGKTRGKVSELLIDATINQALAALQTSGTATDCRNYLKTFLFANYESLRRNSAGGVQPNLNLGLVQKILVPLPPIAEQAAIIDGVAVISSRVEAAEVSAELETKRATRLRQSILKRAFEGKLVPQDPNDEPASVLLERIRAARAAQAAPRAQKRRKSPV